ncbi:DUF4373 domain-containing protein [Bacteroides ovatus]|nr:DUF4373 domain-containing protein [Bacteroides ovatus]
MGRIKQGLDYFPMSTSFMHDRIVRRVMKREGDAAFATLVETLSYIYAGKGYYIPASDEFYDELTDSLYNTDLDDVKRIIALAVECGLFDAGLFRQYGILTSADIQRQYLFITKRRSSSLIDPAYCLLQAEELASYHTSPNSKNSAEDADNKTGCDVTPTADTVTSTTDSATSEAGMSTLGTQNKEKQIKTNQNKINHLSDSPQGENGGGKILKSRKVMTQEDINNLQPPPDGMQRNFEGLLENLHSYKIPPSEQYAIILKSNFGAIGHPVWKGFSSIRGSNGKIKLPGHYLLSVIN